MTKKPRPKLPQAGGSYTVDKAGKPVLAERTLQVHEPGHGAAPAPAATAVELPVKEA